MRQLAPQVPVQEGDLAADAGAGDEEIARSVGVGGSTVYRTKRRFVLGDLPAALSEQPRPGAKRKLSGKEEALLVATACSNPPAGRARWTLGIAYLWEKFATALPESERRILQLCRISSQTVDELPSEQETLEAIDKMLQSNTDGWTASGKALADLPSPEDSSPLDAGKG